MEITRELLKDMVGNTNINYSRQVIMIVNALLNGEEITVIEELKPCLYNCVTELKVTIGVGDLPYATSCHCGAIGKFYSTSDLAKSKHNELYNKIHGGE